MAQFVETPMVGPSLFAKRSQLGFVGSPFDFLATIGFVFLLAGGLLLVYPSVQASARANAENENIVSIVARLKELRDRSALPAPMSAQTLLAAHVFPENASVEGSPVLNVWGGELSVAPAAGPKGAAQAFDVINRGVPSLECEKLASAAGADYLKETVNGVALMDKTASPPRAFDPKAAALACSGQSNTLVVTAR
jgi:hypothetical protein